MSIILNYSKLTCAQSSTYFTTTPKTESRTSLKSIQFTNCTNSGSTMSLRSSALNSANEMKSQVLVSQLSFFAHSSSKKLAKSALTKRPQMRDARSSFKRSADKSRSSVELPCLRWNNFSLLKKSLRGPAVSIWSYLARCQSKR